MSELTSQRIRSAYETAKAALLAEMASEPVAVDDPVQKLLDAPVTEFRYWVGELSTSALSTATAVMALEQMRRQYVAAGREVPDEWLALIHGGIEWLVAHQNSDGGWGDTVKSLSNISTTMLCRATLHAVQSSPVAPRQERRTRTDAVNGTYAFNVVSDVDRATAIVSRSDTATLAQAYIDRAGGVKAVIARYGKDRTFSVPILTHCALAGLVDWDEVISLPFELACIPARFYAAVRLPVVSYALPALIAIGQVRFHFRPSWNPLRRCLQRWAKPASLRVLERIQPPNGGFLEATPLTSFVTMSLAAMGLHDHPVAQRGIEFIVKSAKWDVGWDSVPTCSANDSDPIHSEESGSGQSPNLRACSWPIDTNLATWVTTLAINALGDDVPLDARPGLRAWLLRQQYRVVHPYTNAAPGGWAWTDLPGGVPDADDAPGAMLALMSLSGVTIKHVDSAPIETWKTEAALELATKESEIERLNRSQNELTTARDAIFDAAWWLKSLQNRDGGIPTFCRGWGTLPFDRSSPDITAHVIRAQRTVMQLSDSSWDANLNRRNLKCGRRIEMIDLIENVGNGLGFLERTQRPDGSWLPLWFGNQQAPNDENPTYGTAKVLAAFQALGRMSDESAVRGVRWLVENQNPDGGWGAGPGTPSSVEETALALEALIGAEETGKPRTENEEFAMKGSASHSSFSVLGSPLPGCVSRGLSWLIPRVEDGRFREPSPIGFYFAKLWYFERLYPLIFTVAALRKAAMVCENEPCSSGFEPANDGN